VDEVAAGEGAEFSGCKETCERGIIEPLADDRGVVADTAEETLTAAVAGNKEGRERRIVYLLTVEEELQILVGCLGITQVHLNRLPTPREFADGDGLLVFIDAEYVSHNEIAPPEMLLVCVDGSTDKQAAREEFTFVFG
jgi:hypothetical protein